MDLVYVTHIFYHPETTYCASCDDHFPMDEFEWADTGECITDWYARHASKFKGIHRFLGDELFVYLTIALGLILGGVIGFLAADRWGWWASIIGAIVVAALLGFLGFVIGATIKESICRRVLGTSDFSALE